MDAVLLMDHRWIAAEIDTFLRASGMAEAAAGTLGGDKITAALLGGSAKSERGPLRRKVSEIEPFSCSLIDLKYCQSISGALIGIDLGHVGIFRKKVRNFFRPDFPGFPLYRNSDTGECILAFHGGECDVFICLEPIVKVFSLC